MKAVYSDTLNAEEQRKRFVSTLWKKQILAKVSEIFSFKTAEEQKRVDKNNIEKRHFKFIYDLPINDRPFYI